MTLPKKASRKIVVDGNAYRWRIRHKPTYSQSVGDTNILASVELYESPASTLSIHFPWVRYDSYIGVAEESVTPALIENCIREAINRGWNPSISGPAYKYVHEK